MRSLLLCTVLLVLSQWGLVLGAGLRNGAFPDLGRILSPNHLHGLSHDQILNHQAGKKEQLRLQELKGISSPKQSAEKEEWHLFCTRSDEMQVSSLPEKEHAVEEALGIPLQIVNIDPEFACYSGHVVASQLTLGVSLLERHDFLVQSLPNELKIHRNLPAILHQKSNDIGAISDAALLVIDFYRGVNHTHGPAMVEKTARCVSCAIYHSVS